MEQIDVFDEEFRSIEPNSTTIDVVHQKGLWHQTFACWLVNPKENIVFSQLRGKKNRIGPNTFDASASGHLSAGEKPIEGFREAEEELGKNLNLHDIVFLGINRNVIIQGTYINREFCHIYMAKTENDLKDFQLEDGEVAGLFKLDINQGIKLFSNEISSIKITGIVWDEQSYKIQTREITQQDFCSYHDRVNISGYYLKIMMMAERYVSNTPPYRI